MAMQPETVYLPDDPTPLTATQLPNGQLIISHAPITVDMNNHVTANHAFNDLLTGQILGIDKKLIALGLLAWLVLKK